MFPFGPEIIPGILTHNLEEYVARLEMVEQSAAAWAHVDIMDGQFVPNITVMPHEIMSISTRLKLEAHMMTHEPERYFSDLSVAGVSRIILHRECYEQLEECATALHHAADYFPEVGLAFSPGTPVEPLKELAVQAVLCMGVQPGFSGQAFEPAVYDTIEAVRREGAKAVIAVDGGVSEDNIKQLQKAGVSRFILSSHLFVANNVSQNFQHFIQLVSGGI